MINLECNFDLLPLPDLTDLSSTEKHNIKRHIRPDILQLVGNGKLFNEEFYVSEAEYLYLKNEVLNISKPYILHSRNQQNPRTVLYQFTEREYVQLFYFIAYLYCHCKVNVTQVGSKWESETETGLFGGKWIPIPQLKLRSHLHYLEKRQKLRLGGIGLRGLDVLEQIGIIEIDKEWEWRKKCQRYRLSYSHRSNLFGMASVKQVSILTGKAKPEPTTNLKFRDTVKRKAINEKYLPKAFVKAFTAYQPRPVNLYGVVNYLISQYRVNIRPNKCKIDKIFEYAKQDAVYGNKEKLTASEARKWSRIKAWLSQHQDYRINLYNYQGEYDKINTIMQHCFDSRNNKLMDRIYTLETTTNKDSTLPPYAKLKNQYLLLKQIKKFLKSQLLWYYKPTYNLLLGGGNGGRCYEEKGGLQNISKKIKTLACANLGLFNYDIVAAGPTFLYHEMLAWGINSQWLKNYLLDNQAKTEYARQLGITEGLWKKLLIGSIYSGGLYCSRNIRDKIQQELKITDDLLTKSKIIVADFNKAINPFLQDLRLFRNKLYSEYKTNKNIQNEAELVFQCKNTSIATIKNQLSSFLLQGREAYYLNLLTIHAKNVVANEHDGVISQGKIPDYVINHVNRLTGMQISIIPKSF